MRDPGRMHTSVVRTGLIIMCAVTTAVAAITDQVRRKHERCRAQLERAKLKYDGLTEQIAELENLLSLASLTGDSVRHAYPATMAGKREQLRARLDRAESTSRNVDRDLRTTDGSTCSSCTESNVDLVCRWAELIQSQIAELMRQVRELQAKFRRETDIHSLVNRLTGRLDSLDEAGFDVTVARGLVAEAGDMLGRGDQQKAVGAALAARQEIARFSRGRPPDSAIDTAGFAAQIERGRELAEKTGHKPALIILDKGEEHFRLYKELSLAGKIQDARKEFSIARQFVERALQLMMPQPASARPAP